MARIRTIKPEFFTSADICSLPPLARLLYVALWCEADREGRLVWNPATFKIRYLPGDNCKIDQLCAALVDARLVLLYEMDGEQLAVIPSFPIHQQVNNRESPSRLSAPPEDLTRQARVRHASLTPHEGKGKEGKGSLTTNIEEGWAVPSEWIEQAAKKKPGINWAAEAERFVSNHLSKGSKFKDWKQAWWTWVNSPFPKVMIGAKNANHQPSRKLSAVEQVEQAIREQFASEPDDDYVQPFAQIGHCRTVDADG